MLRDGSGTVRDEVLATLDRLASRADALTRRHTRHANIDTLSEPTPLAHEAPTRQLHGVAAILGASVLTDSAIEHYRGDFRNPAMYTPIDASALPNAYSQHAM